MRRAYPVLLSLALAVPVLTGCGGQTAETTSAFPDATSIVLSDDGVTVDGEAAPTDETAAVYTAHDIVYYEAGRDFTYGEGTEADEHTAEEAAAHTVVHITQPGTYAVSGTLSAGQIAVDLGEDAEDDQSAVVTLILNGADITCTVAPAVIFYSVYECGSTDEDTAAATVDTSAAGANVLIADGTVNNVTGSYVARIYEPDSVVLSEDGTEVADSSKLHKYDGAFYSKMSMNVGGGEDGSGVLNITADNEGLDTELHLTINGGNINITSGNDGINTNEDNVSVTTINDGVLNILVTGETGEGDGIDSNGYLVINGGAVTAAACAESGDAGIDATAGITINGGTVMASGNMYDQIDGGDQTYVVFSFASRQTGGETYTLQNADGETVGTWTPVNDFTCLVVSSPDLTAGDYTLWQGDTQLAGSASDGMGGGRPIDDSQVPGDFDPQQAPTDGERPQRPEGEAPAELQENAGGDAPADPPERPEGEAAPDGAEPPADGRGPGGGEDGQSAADLSEIFALDGRRELLHRRLSAGDCGGGYLIIRSPKRAGPKNGPARFRHSQILLDGVDGPLLQPAHLSLGDAHLGTDLHLSLALVKPQGEDTPLPVVQTLHGLF